MNISLDIPYLELQSKKWDVVIYETCQNSNGRGIGGHLPTRRRKGRVSLHFHVALLASDDLVSLGGLGGFTPLLFPSLTGLGL
jgi:hypothetical protein